MRADEKVLQLTLETKNILRNCGYQFPPNRKLIPEHHNILRELIIRELSEILIILLMIHKSMNSFYIVHEKIMKMTDEKIGEKSLTEEEFLTIRKATEELIILIKVLYEWLYHLKELIENNEKLRSSVPKKLWKKLKAHCDVRNKLITHKEKTQTYLTSFMRFSPRPDIDRFEVLMMPIFPPESAVKELDRLFSECSNELTPEEAREVNFYERCGILYRNLDKFTDEQGRKVVAFIQKYGTILANPPETAELIRDLAITLVPKLASYKDIKV
ncbi:MAG: hypothetical protein QXR44_05490 [Thermoproteota archaeon]